MPAPAITLEKVSVELGGRAILRDLDAQIEAGCLTAILGPNGAGKTTLLHVILGLISFQGRVLFGPERREKRPRIGYVPQKLELDRGSPITVRDFLATIQTDRPLWMGVSKLVENPIHEALERIGIRNLVRAPIGKLSGGELQRVLLVQALLRRPEILLLDEPASAVDMAGEALFCDILDEVQRELGITTLLVSHDLSIISTHARNVICLNGSIICAGPVAQVMTAETIKKVFSPHADVYDHSHSHAPSSS